MRAILFLCPFLALTGALRRSSSKSDLFFHRRRRSASRYERMSWKTHFNEYMSDLKTTSNPDGFNAKCEPFVKEPAGTSRGLVLLSHGYTACPNFWALLTPQLLAKGWTVMAPLLPGHGRNPKIQSNGSSSYIVTDYSADLPLRGEEYETYSKELMVIAGKYKTANSGKKMVLNGISHGGSIALYLAMNGEVGTWDRIQLMNPMLAPPTSMGADFGLSFLRYIIPQALPVWGFLTDNRMTWGEDCDRTRWPGDPRKGGTGGICQFNLENFRGVLEFGNVVEGDARQRAAKMGVFTGGLIDRIKGIWDLLKHKTWEIATNPDKPPTNLRVQLLTTSNDNSISNERVHFMAAAMRKLVVPDAGSRYCSMDAPLGHTYINPPDKPVDLDMWWLDSSRVAGGKNVVELLANFLTDGEVMPVRGTIQADSSLKGDPRCDVTQRR